MIRSRTRKKISYVELIQVLQTVHEKSRPEKLFDFNLANPFLQREGLHGHIVPFERRGKRLYPLNSERHVYDIDNLILRNLDIVKLERHSKFELEESHQLGIKWHFEDCRFQPSSPNGQTISFGWHGSFRFHNNKFDLYDDKKMNWGWLLSFKRGSRVLFEKNDFKDNNLDIVCEDREEDSSVQKLSWDGRDAFLIKDDSYYMAMIRKSQQLPETVRLQSFVSSSRLNLGLYELNFIGNKKIDRLYLRCQANDYVFRGTNCIKHLDFNESSSNFQYLRSMYFGFRERIDPHFDNALHHRELFLSMRKYGYEKQDVTLVNALDKQLERIEYFLVKDKKKSFGGARIEYWQDRIRHEWRKCSSDYSRSWLRPLSFLVLGYIGLNALPGFWIEDFTLSDWVAFSLRSIDRIPFYTAGLKDLHAEAYEVISPGSKNWLRFIGLFQVVWVAIWGVAFSNSIKGMFKK